MNHVTKINSSSSKPLSISNFDDADASLLLYNSKFPMNYNPDYMALFDFEKFEDHEKARQWMTTNWAWSIYASLAYLIIIFLGRRWMQGREPFNLRRALTIWNILLASFSATAFIRSFPELWVSFLGRGGSFYKSVCFLENHNSATSFWGLLFAWSKIIEFGDTVFIILCSRRKSLMFLHWYHHISTCIFCWFSHGSHDPANRWFSDMNLFVHSIMYSYYALRSLQVKVPRGFAISITCLQITQMVVGVVINVQSLLALAEGKECDRPLSNIHASLGMYASYFLLFVHYFYKAYFPKKIKSL